MTKEKGEVVRRLTSAYQEKDTNKWYFSFSYHRAGEFGRMEWTGDAESCYLTEDELYELLKPRLCFSRTAR